MNGRNRRSLKTIEGELRKAMKAEAGSVVTIGKLLIEAKEQVEHGEWTDWLKENFGSSVRTAQNYMNGARFALTFDLAKNATDAFLNLTPEALYLLGARLDELDTPTGNLRREVVEAILKEAKAKAVGYERVWEIAYSMQPPPPEPTEEETEALEASRKAQEERLAEIERERAEAEKTLRETPPPPPPPEPTASPDLEAAALENALRTLERCETKLIGRFTGTIKRDNVKRGIRFLTDLDAAIERQQKEKTP